jgi:hypothetical protein
LARLNELRDSTHPPRPWVPRAYYPPPAADGSTGEYLQAMQPHLVGALLGLQTRRPKDVDAALGSFLGATMAQGSPPDAEDVAEGSESCVKLCSETS